MFFVHWARVKILRPVCCLWLHHSMLSHRLFSSVMLTLNRYTFKYFLRLEIFCHFETWLWSRRCDPYCSQFFVYLLSLILYLFLYFLFYFRKIVCWKEGVSPDMIFVKKFTPAHFQTFENLPPKTRKLRHFKPWTLHFWRFYSFNWIYISMFIYICSLYTCSMGKQCLILPKTETYYFKWT